MDKDEANGSLNKLIWDCGSSLYDSYELKSLTKQFDSALAARCFSMPHYSLTTGSSPSSPARAPKKRPSFAKSIRKMIRSVMRSKPRAADGGASSLRSILEARENKEQGSPETIRKGLSERFTTTTFAELLA
ncbi:hypothetical protein Cni_G17041 [Canna indica]|uniref:Uncharacterized protein n=1 Tax=Canna indica TaxID=4628 RepID=A0AAQ3KJZ3_9LILI|nr:hypothetical protein Cni_G17041 [Canna indica]